MGLVARLNSSPTIEKGYRFLDIGEVTLPTDEFWCMVDTSTIKGHTLHSDYIFEWRLMNVYGVIQAPVVTEHTVEIRRRI